MHRKPATICTVLKAAPGAGSSAEYAKLLRDTRRRAFAVGACEGISLMPTTFPLHIQLQHHDTLADSWARVGAAMRSVMAVADTEDEDGEDTGEARRAAQARPAKAGSSRSARAIAG